MATIDVVDAHAATITLQQPLAPGRAADTASRPVALSNEDVALLSQLHTDLVAPTPAGTNAIGSVTISNANANGQQAMAASAPVVIASNQSSIPVASTLSAETTKVIGTVNLSASQLITPVDQYAQYETVAASATAQALGATGATGDYLAGVLVFPGIAACGLVTILDNATVIGTFAGGGTTALPSLVPFMIPVGLFSVSGAWKITTGASVTAVGIGKFT